VCSKSSSSHRSSLRPDLRNSSEDPHVFKAQRPSTTDSHHPTPRSTKLSLPSSSQPSPTTFIPIEIPSRRNIPFLSQQAPKPTPESSALFGNWRGFQSTTGTSQLPKSTSPKGPKDEQPPPTSTVNEVTSRDNDIDLEAEVDLSEVGLTIRDV